MLIETDTIHSHQKPELPVLAFIPFLQREEPEDYRGVGTKWIYVTRSRIVDTEVVCPGSSCITDA